MTDTPPVRSPQSASRGLKSQPSMVFEVPTRYEEILGYLSAARRNIQTLLNAISFHLIGRHCDIPLGQQDESKYAHPIWAAIKLGSVEEVMGYVTTNASCLALRGDVGETPLHWCFLYYGANQRQIARWVMEFHPSVTDCAYEGEFYEGENVLHMAIVHRDMEMVEWLVDIAPYLLDGRCIGQFFQPGGGCYYGDSPLMFAACTNQRAIFDLLLAKGSDLTLPDNNGNSIFHLLVYQGLPEMYDYVCSLWDRKDGDPALLLNWQLLSPLTLAAKLGQRKMLEHLLAKRDVVEEWRLGSLAQYLYPLDEVDFIPSTDERPDRPTVIDLLLHEGHADLLRLPRIFTILTRKAVDLQPIFFRQLLESILRAVLFTFAIVFDDVEDSRIFASARICGILVVAWTLYSVWQVLGQISGGGLGFFNVKGSHLLRNVTTLTLGACTTVSFLLHITGVWEYLETILLAVAGISTWLYIMSFLLSFRLTGPFIIMISEMLMRDLLCFLSIYAVFTLAFTTSMSCLCKPVGPYGFLQRLESSVLLMANHHEGFDQDCGGGFQEMLAVFLMVMNTVLVSVLLVNLLIAMMETTYERITEVADNKWLLEWARLMTSLQKELKGSQKLHYWVENDGIRYIEIIQPIAKAPDGKILPVRDLALCRAISELGGSATIDRTRTVIGSQSVVQDSFFRRNCSHDPGCHIEIFPEIGDLFPSRRSSILPEFSAVHFPPPSRNASGHFLGTYQIQHGRSGSLHGEPSLLKRTSFHNEMVRRRRSPAMVLSVPSPSGQMTTLQPADARQASPRHLHTGLSPFTPSPRIPLTPTGVSRARSTGFRFPKTDSTCGFESTANSPAGSPMGADTVVADDSKQRSSPADTVCASPPPTRINDEQALLLPRTETMDVAGIEPMVGVSRADTEEVINGQHGPPELPHLTLLDLTELQVATVISNKQNTTVDFEVVVSARSRTSEMGNPPKVSPRDNEGDQMEIMVSARSSNGSVVASLHISTSPRYEGAEALDSHRSRGSDHDSEKTIVYYCTQPATTESCPALNPEVGISPDDNVPAKPLTPANSLEPAFEGSMVVEWLSCNGATVDNVVAAPDCDPWHPDKFARVFTGDGVDDNPSIPCHMTSPRLSTPLMNRRRFTPASVEVNLSANTSPAPSDHADHTHVADEDPRPIPSPQSQQERGELAVVAVKNDQGQQYITQVHMEVPHGRYPSSSSSSSPSHVNHRKSMRDPQPASLPQPPSNSCPVISSSQDLTVQHHEVSWPPASARSPTLTSQTQRLRLPVRARRFATPRVNDGNAKTLGNPSSQQNSSTQRQDGKVVPAPSSNVSRRNYSPPSISALRSPPSSSLPPTSCKVASPSQTMEMGIRIRIPLNNGSSRPMTSLSSRGSTIVWTTSSTKTLRGASKPEKALQDKTSDKTTSEVTVEPEYTMTVSPTSSPVAVSPDSINGQVACWEASAGMHASHGGGLEVKPQPDQSCPSPPVRDIAWETSSVSSSPSQALGKFMLSDDLQESPLSSPTVDPSPNFNQSNGMATASTTWSSASVSTLSASMSYSSKGSGHVRGAPGTEWRIIGSS